MLRKPALAAIATVSLAVLLAGCQAPAAEKGTVSTPYSVVSNAGSASPSASASPQVITGAGPSCPTNACTTLLVTGDMLFHAGLWNQYKTPASADGRNFNFVPLLEGQVPYLKTADAAICHMETPLAAAGGPYSGYPIFNIPPEIAADAKTVGYDACTQASNHSVDRGSAGIARSIATMDAAGLGHTGIYASAASAANDILTIHTPAATVAVVNGTFSLNGLTAEYPWQVDGIDSAALVAKAKRARAAGADIVVAGLHVGTEYQTTPNAQQLELDRALIDSGEFDFVYNHHSHAAQPLEKYHGKWIAYSLGNNISESSDNYRVNNEFLMIRIQFAKDAAGVWTASDMAWVPAINKQGAKYVWCSVASDKPQGTCVSNAFDTESRARLQKVINAMGAEAAGAHELVLRH